MSDSWPIFVLFIFYLLKWVNVSRGNGLRGVGVLYEYVREHGPPVVVQECLEVFNLGISAGRLFENGTARLLTA